MGLTPPLSEILPPMVVPLWVVEETMVIRRKPVLLSNRALICSSPALTAVTIPDASTVANGGADDDQVASGVTSLEELSEYRAAALNCALSPSVRVVGPETATDTSVAVGEGVGEGVGDGTGVGLVGVLLDEPPLQAAARKTVAIIRSKGGGLQGIRQRTASEYRLQLNVPLRRARDGARIDREVVEGKGSR